MSVTEKQQRLTRITQVSLSPIFTDNHDMRLHLFRKLTLIFILFGVGACASDGTKTMMFPDDDGGSTAEGAAYTADSMHFRKAMPSHADWRPVEFYFKHCSEIGDQSYFSKTSYECTSP